MTSKLISYVLGCAIAFSAAQDLKASLPQEESGTSETKRKVKVPEGRRAPTPSLAVAETPGGPDFLRKLQALEIERDSQQSTFPPQNKKEKVKKTAAGTSPSESPKVKKKRAKQAPPSKPVTTDVPLPEDASSAPQCPAEVETATSPSQGPERREITTLDVATLMPSVPAKPAVALNETTEKPAAKSSPKMKEKKEKKAKKGNKKEEVPQAAPSAAVPVRTRVGGNVTPQGLWDLIPTKRPQVKEETPLLQNKDIFAPQELFPIHLLLALAAGTRQEVKQDPITKKESSVTKRNKVYIPDLRMFLGYKIMQAGKLEDLKEKLLFKSFSQNNDFQTVLKLISIKGKEDFSKITTAFMQKATGEILSLTKKHFFNSGIRILQVKDEVTEKRAEGSVTLGENYKGNYGIYELEVDGKIIEGLRMRLDFTTSK